MLIYLNCKLRTFTLKHLSYLGALSPPYRARFNSKLNSQKNDDDDDDDDDDDLSIHLS